MKTLPSLLLSAALMAGISSCHAPFAHITYYINYQEAGQGKLFITESNSVSFEYEPLGSILVEEIPGSVKITVPTTEKEQRKSGDDIYGTRLTTKSVTSYAGATAQSALNYAANEAIRMGADGLINLKLSTYMDNQKHHVVQVSGMVVKRKNIYVN